VEDLCHGTVEEVGPLKAHESEADGAFVHRHTEGVANANGQVLERCIPVAMVEQLSSHPIEAVSFVALQVVDEEFVAKFACHQPVGACPRPL